MFVYRGAEQWMRSFGCSDARSGNWHGLPEHRYAGFNAGAEESDAVLYDAQ